LHYNLHIIALRIICFSVETLLYTWYLVSQMLCPTFIFEGPQNIGHNIYGPPGIIFLYKDIVDCSFVFSDFAPIYNGLILYIEI